MSGHSRGPITIHPVKNKAELREFVELAYRLNRGDPERVQPLRGEVYGLLTPGKKHRFENGKAYFFLTRRVGRTISSIPAHSDELSPPQHDDKALWPCPCRQEHRRQGKQV